MSAAPGIKYTDRDVRENEDLTDEVYRYVRGYTGEFQFLVDAKMALERDQYLPVPVVRGVLNCMRVDPRVAGTLPAPLPPKDAEQVIKLEPERRKRRKPWIGDDITCEKVDQRIEHGGHGYENDKEAGFCKGWHLINRDPDKMVHVAKLKVPFVMARGGFLVHAVMPISEAYPEVAWYKWNGERHDWGFYEYGNGPADLTVKLACKYPSYITRGVLLTEQQAISQVTNCMRRLCPHCGIKIEETDPNGL